MKQKGNQSLGGNQSKIDSPAQQDWLKTRAGHKISTSETEEENCKCSASTPNMREAESGASGVQGQLLLLNTLSQKVKQQTKAKQPKGCERDSTTDPTDNTKIIRER